MAINNFQPLGHPQLSRYQERTIYDAFVEQVVARQEDESRRRQTDDLKAFFGRPQRDESPIPAIQSPDPVLLLIEE